MNPAWGMRSSVRGHWNFNFCSLKASFKALEANGLCLDLKSK